MRIAMAQINTVVGDFEANLVKIESYIERARREKADMVLFPELALCGYPPEDLLFKKIFLKQNKKYLKRVADASVGIMTVMGHVDHDVRGIYNGLSMVRDGRVEATYRKIMLPNYGVFDEKRYFLAGDEVVIVEYLGERICLSVCEDIWTGEEMYASVRALEPFSLMINISSSPFHQGKLQVRENMIRDRARKLGCAIVYCNLVGGQDELVFDGGSFAVDSRGRLAVHAGRFEEDMAVFDTSKPVHPVTVRTDTVTEVYEAVRLGLHDYVNKNNFRGVLVGLSGGIDSAVVAAVAVDALGKENVTGVLMPSEFTSRETLRDAHRLAECLGISSHTIPITSLFKTFRHELQPYLDGCGPAYELTLQNIQARLRGNILMALSNRLNAMVLNTGNKSELSVGYSTLYGDMVGGYGLLKDVYKTLVFELARYINRRAKRMVIPPSIIARPPSAELKADQRDEDDLLPYERLDKILKQYIEEDRSWQEIVAMGYDRQEVRRVVRMVDRNEYKRRQGPPGIKITPRAFGKDRRMPITNRFA